MSGIKHSELVGLYGELVWQTESGLPDPKVLAEVGLKAIALERIATSSIDLEYLNRIWQEASYGIQSTEEGWITFEPGHPLHIIDTGPFAGQQG